MKSNVWLNGLPWKRQKGGSSLFSPFLNKLKFIKDLFIHHKKAILVSFIIALLAIFLSVALTTWFNIEKKNNQTKIESSTTIETENSFNDFISKNAINKNDIVESFTTRVANEGGVIDKLFQPIVEGLEYIITNNEGRLSQNQLDQVFNKKSTFTSVTENTGRLSSQSLKNTFASTNEFNTEKDKITKGYLSLSNLNKKYTSLSTFSVVDKLINEGDLSDESLNKKFLTKTYLDSWSPNNFVISHDALSKKTLVVDNSMVTSELEVGKESKFLDTLYIGDEGDLTVIPSIPPSPGNLRVIGSTTLTSVKAKKDFSVGEVNKNAAFTISGSTKFNNDVRILNSPNVGSPSSFVLNGDLQLKEGLHAKANTVIGSSPIPPLSASLTKIKGTLDLRNSKILPPSQNVIIRQLVTTRTSGILYRTTTVRGSYQYAGSRPTYSFEPSKTIVLDSSLEKGFSTIVSLYVNSNSSSTTILLNSTEMIFISQSDIEKVKAGSSNQPYNHSFTFQIKYFPLKGDNVRSLSSDTLFDFNGNSEYKLWHWGTYIFKVNVNISITLKNGKRTLTLETPTIQTVDLDFYIGDRKEAYLRGTLYTAWSKIRDLVATFAIIKT